MGYGCASPNYMAQQVDINERMRSILIDWLIESLLLFKHQIRMQQRNGRKSLTTVQGLKKEFRYNKILKDLKKEFCCNGTVVQDPELGQVIQLQGDQRKNVSTFLFQAGIVKKEHIKIHGF